MTSERSFWSLSGSLVLHGLLVLALLALASRELPQGAIIVELEGGARVSEPVAPPAPSRAGTPPRSISRAIRRPLASAPAPQARHPLVPEPPSWSEPLPEPSPSESGELLTPIAAPATGQVADVTLEPVGSDWTGGRRGRESGGGPPSGGPLAMLAPSGKGGEEGMGLAAAAPGGGDGAMPAEFGPYLARFRQRIQESMTYPLTARRRGLGGTVHLEIELLPTGRVASVLILAPSSHTVLNQAALDTVGRLAPVPFPRGVPPRPVKVRLPIVFELQ